MDGSGPRVFDSLDGIEPDDDSECSYKTMHSSEHSSIENSQIPDLYAHLPGRVRREVQKHPWMLAEWEGCRDEDEWNYLA